MFEKVEVSQDLKAFLDKWKGKPHEPWLKDKARHWTDVLGIDKDFFFETLKMRDQERESAFAAKPEIADKYHAIWERLRENGWRRTQDRDGVWHWSCMFEHLIRRKTDRVFTASESDQERWEKEYYDDVFVEEGE
jgi:hypothetical protein